ncbi:iron(III) ABC transporter ATP-binding protein [Oceanimonas sp. GK1]|uniref:ABC transporter ATP-binding protein n=1 Tax=Oceanimonas sp. (strain GK1 / IBRC-M 10197) TaxID=511062 RepID=UPI0002495299|nr:ABC transporter ATP-binding protein [Oceanimonas sp. GK1]AEY02806.1 iron(III) ABC transporter ATP-binding protein [Oceanimonas sp. GK1]
MAALTIHDICCSYNGKPVLNGLSLEVEDNEIMCLLGASGCGKTTLLKAVAGLLPVASGDIAINGRPVNGHGLAVVPEERNIGMIFQDYALFPHLNVAQNVAFGLQSKESNKAVIHARVEEVLELVNLAGLGERYPHQLSGGQQQRVAIARALICRPQLMLLDEPFSNIDTQVRMRLIGEIRSLLKQQGISAIFVTHSKEEAFAFADKLALFRAGHIEQVGRPQTLYQHPQTPFVADFLGQSNYVPATVHDSHTLVTPIGSIESQAALNAEPGSEGQLLLRPRQLQLTEDEQGNGRVLEQQFLGAHTRCQVDCQGLLLEVSINEPLPPQARVQVRVAAHALTFFPDQSERRREVA